MAAVTVATRVADEFGCAIGDEVGYGVRFDFKCSSKTVIKYYTDGVLLRETLTDPLLSKYSVIIIDEAHMRSLHSDVLLGLLKKIQRRRPELRLIVTSATLDAMVMKDFFESGNSILNAGSDGSLPPGTWKDTACILSVQGRQHDVDILYMQTPCRNYMRETVATVLSIHKHENWGDILVFLPGAEEIDTVIEMLQEEYDGDHMYFLPLYSALPKHQQMLVFEPSPLGKRKVVLATNVAEASITIEGICFVIDCGFSKVNFFDYRSGVEALVTVPISRSAAQQRAGRAGRTQEGKCFRLTTEAAFYDAKLISDYSVTEMQRTDISWAVLQLKALGIHDVLHFDFLSAPSTDSMIYSLELLFSLEAMDDKGKLTGLGAKMAEMPIEPRLARALLSSHELDCEDEMLSIAAMASLDQSPFITIRSKRASQEARKKLAADIEEFSVIGSDHLTLLAIYEAFERNNYGSSWCDECSLLFKVLSSARKIRSNLQTMLKKFTTDSMRHRSGSDGSSSSSGSGVSKGAGLEQKSKTVLKCLVSGFFSQAARLGPDGHYYTLRGNAQVDAHSSSVIARVGAPPEWVIYNNVYLSKQVTELKVVSKIEPMWLIDLAEHYYSLKM